MIDLYYTPSPNGHKITLFLEEAQLQYRLIHVDISKGSQFRPDFLQISPNNKIPAIIDHAPVDGGRPISLFESGEILLYLAEKSGKLLSGELRERHTTLQWLFWQVSGLGPMLGQNHHFSHYAPQTIPYAIERYQVETQRLYNVMNKRLESSPWLGGDHYSIADIAIFPWVRNLIGFYAAGDLVEFGQFRQVQRVLDAFVARPAVARGLNIPARG